MHRTYVGIDLAAQPRRTGLAMLREDGEHCVLDQVTVGAEDLALARQEGWIWLPRARSSGSRT